MAFRFSIVSDVREVLRGNEAMEQGFDDTADSLNELARTAQQRGREIGRSVEGVGDEADDASTKIERKFRDAFDTVRQESKRTGDDTKRNLELTEDDVFKASLKAELVSNMAESGAEVARGFKDGFDSEDVETIIDGISDTIVSVGAMTGSALGAAGGLAAATGLNLIAAPLIADAEAKAALYEQVYTDAFDTIKENGAALGEQIVVQSQIAAITSDIDKMNEVRQRSNDLNVEASLVVGAMAGSTDDLNEVTRLANATIDEQSSHLRSLAEQYQSGDITAAEFNAAQEGVTSVLDAQREALGAIQGEYDTHNKAVQDAASGVDALNRATERTNNDLTTQAQSLAASSGQAQDFAVSIDGATTKLRAMPDGKIVQVTDQGTADLTQRQIDGIDGKTVPMALALDTAAADRELVLFAARAAARTVRIATSFGLDVP